MFGHVQMNGYVVEECLFNMVLLFHDDLRCLHQLLDLMLALLQVNASAFMIFYINFSDIFVTGILFWYLACIANF